MLILSSSDIFQSLQNSNVKQLLQGALSLSFSFDDDPFFDDKPYLLYNCISFYWHNG